MDDYNFLPTARAALLLGEACEADARREARWQEEIVAVKAKIAARQEKWRAEVVSAKTKIRARKRCSGDIWRAGVILDAAS